MKNMMKKIPALLMALTLVVSAAACSNSAAAGKDRLAQVQETKKLKVGMETTYPPMEFTDEKGSTIGFDVDLMAAIAQKLGVQMDVVPTDFAGITEGLAANRFDVIASGMNITEKRKESVLFSDPYIDAVGLSLILRPEEKDVKKFSDLAGKKIGLQQGSTADEWARSQSNLGEVKEYLSISEALLDLSAGRIQAVVTDNVVGAYYIKKDPKNYQMPKELLEAGPLGIAIPKDAPELKAQIDAALKTLKAEGTLANLSEKWFGTNIYQK
ncbi:hypothetical protein ABB02_00810 [Clostridiaceae bacterium JG1575]|nr:hypothetical protein ABB02_00810 [Clostridiaceae bacterium JG1575]